MEKTPENSSDSEQAFGGQELASELNEITPESTQTEKPTEISPEPSASETERDPNPPSPEKPELKSLIVSLLGPTASGKSTLIEQASHLLLEKGIASTVIKKDDAIRKISVERHGQGKEWRGYTPLRKFTETDVNREINRRLHEQIGKSSVIFLEGGTRTRKLADTTLEGIKDKADYVIVKLDIPGREVRKRLGQRRKEKGRVDDLLILAGLKLAGQYARSRIGESPKESDPDVRVLDAKASPDEVSQSLLSIIEDELPRT